MKHIYLSIVFILTSAFSYAMTVNDTDALHSSVATDIYSPANTADAGQDAEKPVVSYVPEVFGAVKAKLEVSTYDGEHRFNVRNSRIGVKGNVTSKMRYMIQIDFNNEGKISVMDALAAYKMGDFEISMGQQQYQFSTDLDRGPNTNWFANRSFLAKYLMNYVSSDPHDAYVGNLGSRDLGIMLTYDFHKASLPFKLKAGIFNGTGANNPDWSNTVNFVGRAEFGAATGLGGAVSYYGGKTPEYTYSLNVTSNMAHERLSKQSLNVWGMQVHYAAEDYRVEAEFAQRRLEDRQMYIMNAGHIQGYYQFRLLPNSAGMDYIAPVARWDRGNNVEFLNLHTDYVDKISAHRATIGVNFGFVKKLVGAEIRLNYEKYFIDNKPTDIKTNHLFQDKFTVEVVASF